LVRDDFPGGWASDKRNAFLASERTPTENKLWSYTAALGQTRKNHRACFASPMSHLIPRKGQYHFLRSDGEHHLLVVTNASDQPDSLDWSSLSPLQNGAKTGTSVLGIHGSGPSEFDWGQDMTLEPWHFQVYLLR